MLIHYLDRPFRYEPSAEAPFTGRLLLDDDDRAWLHRMMNANDCWYLDDEGDRLAPEPLFQATPWSWRGPSGTVKLLQRYLDWKAGEVHFDTLDTYFGPLMDWMYGGDSGTGQNPPSAE